MGNKYDIDDVYPIRRLWLKQNARDQKPLRLKVKHVMSMHAVSFSLDSKLIQNIDQLCQLIVHMVNI